MLTFFLLSSLFSIGFSGDADLCVTGTPYSSTLYWDGNWTINGTWNNVDYYFNKVPGDYFYLYLSTYWGSGGDCPSTTSGWCWCLNEYDPSSGWSCDAYGEIDNSSVPVTAVTSWDEYYGTGNSSLWNDFDISTYTGGSCVDESVTGSCWKINGLINSLDQSDTYDGTYAQQGKQLWWHSDQYRTKYGSFFGAALYSYLFITTGSGGCNSTVLEQNNVNYCWCVWTGKAGTVYDSDLCYYELPIDDTNTKPTDNTYSWYDGNGAELAGVTVEEPSESVCDKANAYKLFSSFTFLFVILQIFFS